MHVDLLRVISRIARCVHPPPRLCCSVRTQVRARPWMFTNLILLGPTVDRLAGTRRSNRVLLVGLCYPVTMLLPLLWGLKSRDGRKSLGKTPRVAKPVIGILAVDLKQKWTPPSKLQIP